MISFSLLIFSAPEPALEPRTKDIQHCRQYPCESDRNSSPVKPFAILLDDFLLSCFLLFFRLQGPLCLWSWRVLDLHPTAAALGLYLARDRLSPWSAVVHISPKDSSLCYFVMSLYFHIRCFTDLAQNVKYIVVSLSVHVLHLCCYPYYHYYYC